MRLGIVARSVWPAVGGIQQHVRTLSGALRDAHEVQIFAHRIDGDGIEWKGPFDRAAPFPPFIDPETGIRTIQLRLTRAELVTLAFASAAAKAVRRMSKDGDRAKWSFELWHAAVAGHRFEKQFEQVELLHRFGGNRMSLATVRAARRMRVPVVITPFAHPGQWDDDVVSAAAYQQADLILATSRADARTYEQLGVDPERIMICPLPTPPPKIHGGDRGVEHPLRDPAVPLVLFLGARRAYKGIDKLIGASRFLERCCDAQVAFAGPGPALTGRLPGNVLDIGQISDDQREAWLAASDLVCLPSSAESFGLVVSEAWSHGVPVVTSDIPVLRERVQECGAGLAVTAEPGELAYAIADLVRNDERRRAMGRRGHAYWERHLTPAAVASRHQEAYRRLAEDVARG